MACLILVSYTAKTKGQVAVVAFTNVRIFDGRSDQLTEPTNLLVVGNTIKQIGDNLEVPADATVMMAREKR